MDNPRKEDPILTANEVRHLLEFLRESPATVEGEHLTEGDLVRYGQGGQREAEVERIDQHLASCETCAIRMEQRLTIQERVLAVQSEGCALVEAKVVSVGSRQAFVAPAAERERNFELFLAEVEPKLRRLLATYRIPLEDGEDILQQSLLALLYQWKRVRDPEGWLFGTVRRHCLMFWRNNRRRIYSAVDAAILEWLSKPIAPLEERSDFLSDLERLIDRLPPRCRTLIRLRFQLGYEPLEVAEKLGYRPSSIGKITNRCLAALSRELLFSGLVESSSGKLRPDADVDAKDPRGETGTGDGEATKLDGT